MTNKRMISSVLSLIMALSLALPVCADSTGDNGSKSRFDDGRYLSNGEYLYTVNDDDTVTLNLYIGNDDDIVVPEEIDGKTVTELGIYEINGQDDFYPEYSVFADVFHANSLTLPSTIKKASWLLYGGFFDKIDIGDGIETIPLEMLFMQEHLKELRIGSSVKRLVERQLDLCTDLKELYVPETVEEIGDHAFGMTNKGVIEDFILYCKSGSAAEEYAVANGINYYLVNIDPALASKGDITFDDIIDTKDALKAVSFAKKSIKPRNAEFTAADVNADGRLDSKDAMLLINAAKNKTAIE